MSPASKAQQKAVNKYMKSNYDRVNLVMPKGKKMLFRHMQHSRGNPSMPISTVLLMRPCSGMILQLKCINVRSRRRISLRRLLTSIIYRFSSNTAPSLPRPNALPQR